MKLAIHNSTSGFHPYWMSYCEQEHIPFKKVDCYASNIIEQLSDCDALLFHHAQTNSKDVLFAKQLLFSLEQSGFPVFPNFNTAWHFDDKVGQKYLLEQLGIPMVPSYVFYSKEKALEWIAATHFPKVFKLRGGAGSAHVRLARTKEEARQLVQQAFGKGFRQYEPMSNFKERLRKFRSGSGSAKELAKGAARFIYPPYFDRVMGRELGYVYFQDFISGSTFDIRIVVVNDKATGMIRHIRPNDFRASGSELKEFDAKKIPIEVIKLSFNISKKLKTQSLAIDFIWDKIKNKWLVIEISYGFTTFKYDYFWDSDINFYNDELNCANYIAESISKKM